jgi:hypothetical protein
MACSYNGDIIIAASTRASVIYASYDSGNSWYVDPRFTTGAGGALQIAALSANGYVQVGIGSNSGIQTLINTPQTTGAPPITLTISTSQTSVSTTVPLGTTGYSIIPFLRNIQGPETFIWTSLTSGPRLWAQTTELFANIVRTTTSGYASGVVQFKPVTTQPNTQLCMLILSDLCSSANTTNLLYSNLSFPVGAGSPPKITSFYPPGNPDIQGFLYYSPYTGNYDLNPGLYVFTFCNNGASSIQRTPINIAVPTLPITNLTAVPSSFGQNIILSWSPANLYNLYDGYLTYDIYSNGSLLTNISATSYIIPNIGESAQFDVVTVAGSFLSTSSTIYVNPPTGPSYINVSGLASTNRIRLEWDPTTTLPSGTAYTYNIFSNGIFVSNTGSTVANTSFGLVPTTAANATEVGQFFSVTLLQTGGYQSPLITTISSAQIINDNKNTRVPLRSTVSGSLTFTIPSSFVITDMIVIGQGGLAGTGGIISSPYNEDLNNAQTIHYGAPAAGGQGGYIIYSNGKGPIFPAGAQISMTTNVCGSYFNPGEEYQLILASWNQYADTSGSSIFSISGDYYYVYNREGRRGKAGMSSLKINGVVIAAAGGGGGGGNTPGNDGVNNPVKEDLYPVIADGNDGHGIIYGINGTGGQGGGSMVFASSNVLKYPQAINAGNMVYYQFFERQAPLDMLPPYQYWLPYGRPGTGGKFVNFVTLCGGTYTTGEGATGMMIVLDGVNPAGSLPGRRFPGNGLKFSPAGKTTSGILSEFGYGGGMSFRFNYFANIPYTLYPGNGFVSISYAYVLLK